MAVEHGLETWREPHGATSHAAQHGALIIGKSVTAVIDGDWLVRQRGWALSRPLRSYNGAILDHPKFKETDLWNDNLMSSEIWNCPFFSSLAFSGFRGRSEKKSGRSSTFFFESKLRSSDDERINTPGVFRRHISISVRRCRCRQMRAEVEGGGGVGGGLQQQMAECRNDKKKKKRRRRCDETEGGKKTNFFSCWDLNC